MIFSVKKPFLLLIVSVLPFCVLFAQNTNSLMLEQFSGLFTNVAYQTVPCVMKIAASRRGETSVVSHQQQLLQGSGFLVSSDGYILTSGHVVEGASSISVYFRNTEVEAALIKVNLDVDLAVLKIDGMNLPYLILGDSDETLIGEWVISVGYPFSMQPFVTKGIIGAKDESGKFLFTDALINPGNSGGPLLNLRGEVIGIINALMLSDEELRGIGIVTTINQIKPLIPI